MSEKQLHAHSLAEAFFYMMVAYCDSCGKRGMQAGQASPDPGEGFVRMHINGECKHCGHSSTWLFRVPGDLLAISIQQQGPSANQINPKPDPSQIIDVGQWIVLSRTLIETAATVSDNAEARKVAYEAAQCLEEALKFYDEDNDLPPDWAFFTETSRRMRTDHPNEFSRDRLINTLTKLPRREVMSEASTKKQNRKPWWKLWK